MGQSRYRLETRALTEGAIMAALTAVLAIINLYIPFMGIIVALIWTLPIVSVCVRQGMRAGILTMAAATLIIMMVASPVSALTMIVPCAAPALLLGNALRHRHSTAKTLLITSIGTLLSMLASLGLALLLTGVSPWEQWLNLKNSLLSSFDMMLPMYEQSGALNRMGLTAEEFSGQWRTAMNMMEMILPALLLVSSIASAFVNYIMANAVLVKLKVDLPEMIPFRFWRLPWWNIWGFTIAFGLALLGSRFLPQYPIISNIGFNIIIFYAPIFVASGLTVASFYIHRFPKERRRLYKIILIASFFLMMNGFIFVIGTIGLFDTVFDYRRLGHGKSKLS